MCFSLPNIKFGRAKFAAVAQPNLLSFGKEVRTIAQQTSVQCDRQWGQAVTGVSAHNYRPWGEIMLNYGWSLCGFEGGGLGCQWSIDEDMNIYSIYYW